MGSRPRRRWTCGWDCAARQRHGRWPLASVVRRNKSVRRADPDLLSDGGLPYLTRGKPQGLPQVIVLSRQVKRPRLSPFDRWILASVAGRFRDLLTAILVVKPETVIRWHRAGWRKLW